MTNVTLQAAQLLALLNANDVDRPIGVAPELLDDKGTAEVATLGDAEQALVAVVADPQFVIRSQKETPHQSDQETHWYYVSGTNVVALTIADSAECSLARFGDIRAVLHQVDRWLTPRLVNDDHVYKIVADIEDVIAVQDMRDVWAEVPALSVIESYGLDVSTASDIFDTMAEPEWRGRIDFLQCQDGDIVAHRTIRVLQGGAMSWLSYPRSEHKRHIVVETAQEGALRAAIDLVWDGISNA